MSCLNNRKFRKLRRRIKNKMRKVTDNPTEYLNKVNELNILYCMYKGDDRQERNKKIDGYLISKGLLSIGEIEEERKSREDIKEDNKYVKEVRELYEDMNNKLIELQEYVVLNVEDMKKTRILVQKKIRILSQISESKRIKRSGKGHIM